MRTLLSALFVFTTNFALAQFSPSELFTYSSYENKSSTLFFQKFDESNSYQFTITLGGECNETMRGTIVNYDNGLIWQTGETTEKHLKFTFGGGTINQPFPICVVELLHGEEHKCSGTGMYIGETYPSTQPNYAGKIGNYPIEMYLSNPHFVGTGRFTLQHGYYYYNSQKQPIYIRANGYFGNAMGQGGGLTISELDYDGQEQAIFEIIEFSEKGYSGTWKSTRNDTKYIFYLYKK